VQVCQNLTPVKAKPAQISQAKKSALMARLQVHIS